MQRFKWATGERVWLTAAKSTLEGRCFGPSPADAPTIVLLHEGLGCVELWRDFPRRLCEATGYGVFAWSRAGYGYSDAVALPRSRDYMTHEAMIALPEVLTAIDFKRGMLLGHSDGATITAIYAGSVDDPRVESICVIAPHFFTEPVGQRSIAKAKAAYDRGELRDKLARYHRDPDNTFRGWSEAWLAPGFEDWNIEHLIDTISVPVLAIQGVNDQYGTLAQLETLRQRVRGPVDIEVLADCGHSPHREQLSQTVNCVARFIETNDNNIASAARHRKRS